MRPALLAQTGTGQTSWSPIDYAEVAFGIGLGLAFSTDSNLTASVDYTFSDTGPEHRHNVSISQATTVATVTDWGHNGKGHQLLTGDSADIQASGIGIDGEYTVTVTNNHTYTFTAGISQTTVSVPDCNAIDLRVYTHPTLQGLTARAAGNFAWPIRAVRLRVSSGTTGYAYLDIIQGHGLS